MNAIHVIRCAVLQQNLQTEISLVLIVRLPVYRICYNGQQEICKVNAIFWDVTPCGSCKNRRFGGNYPFHNQGEKNHLPRNNVSSN
jgi:hypothetical protein